MERKEVITRLDCVSEEALKKKFQSCRGIHRIDQKNQKTCVPPRTIELKEAWDLHSQDKELLIDVSQLEVICDKVFLTGVLNSTASITLEIVNFRPFFLISCPSHWEEKDLAVLVKTLNTDTFKPKNFKKEPVKGNSVYGAKFDIRKRSTIYDGRKPTRMINITFNNWSSLTHYRSLFADVKIFPQQDWSQEMFHERWTLEQQIKVSSPIRLNGWIQIDATACNLSLLEENMFDKEVDDDDDDEMELNEKTGEYKQKFPTQEERDAWRWTKAVLEGKCKLTDIIGRPEIKKRAPRIITIHDIETVAELALKLAKKRPIPPLPVEYRDTNDKKDIEWEKEAVQHWPKSKNPRDRVICVSTFFWVVGDKEPFFKMMHGLCRGSPKFLKETCIYYWDTPEEEPFLLEHWKRCVRDRLDMEWLGGFNSDAYDLPFLFFRALATGAREFNYLGRFRARAPGVSDKKREKLVLYMEEKKASSKQRGDQKFECIQMPGCVHFDSYKSCYALEPQLNVFTLKSVADVLLDGKLNKKDMDYDLIPPYFAMTLRNQDEPPKGANAYQTLIYESEKAGVNKEELQTKIQAMPTPHGTQIKTKEELDELAAIYNGALWDYCEGDVLVTFTVTQKQFWIQQYVETSNLTNTSMSALMGGGQQIRTWNVFIEDAHRRGWYLSHADRLFIQRFYGFEMNEHEKGDSDMSKYEGATVLPPVAGYYNQPVATLDFASLYPSIIMGFNLCFSTWILFKITGGKIWFPHFGKSLEEQRTDEYVLWDISVPNRPPVKDDQTLILITDAGKKTMACWVQKTKKDPDSILPVILAIFIDKRKAVKKEMEATKDEYMAKVLDSSQKAIKVSCNSAYGFCGAQKGRYGCMIIAIITCAIGRIKIEYTRDQAELKEHGADVIYGDTDSVFIKFNPKLTVDEVAILAKKICEHVNKNLPHPMKLEFEKIQYPFMLFKKKSYAGMKVFEGKKLEKAKLLCKGVSSVRRDCPGFSRDAGKKVIQSLLDNKGDPKEALTYIQKPLQMLVEQKIPVHQLTRSTAVKDIVDTKRMNKNGKENPKLIQVNLVDRMRKDGIPVHIGSRINYLVRVANEKDDKYCDRGVDLETFIAQKMKPDWSYYMEKTMVKPLTRLLKIVVSESDLKRMFDRFQGEVDRKQNNILSVETSYAGFTRIAPSTTGFIVALPKAKPDIMSKKRKALVDPNAMYVRTSKKKEQKSTKDTDKVIQCRPITSFFNK